MSRSLGERWVWQLVERAIAYRADRAALRLRELSSASGWPPSWMRRSSINCSIGTTSTTSRRPMSGSYPTVCFTPLAGLRWWAGLFWLGGLRSRRALDWRRWGGALLGAGAFQLYDGTVQHKLMRLHQIRYDVDITPYDVTWNIIAAIMIAIGLAILLVARRGRPRLS